MYEDPTQFRGTVQVEDLKQSYGMMNKLLHYNLLSMGAEKTPNIEKLALLDAVMSRKAIDFSLFIWEIMREFTQTRKPKANLPFGNLVTRMCDHFNVKGYDFDKITPPEIRAIGKASCSKMTTMGLGEHTRATRLESSGAGPSSAEPVFPGPSISTPECSVSQRLDALEEIV